MITSVSSSRIDSDDSRHRATESFPAGSNGEFDLPSELTTVIAGGNGCRLQTTDGREMLDFSMGWGSALVGHAHPKVIDAVGRRLNMGANFATITDASLELAEKLIEISPACEQLRFCASGTEATMYCLRLARAATGKHRILRFEGAYHGAHDVGVTNLFPTDRYHPPIPQPSCDGLTAHHDDGVIVAPFNDIDTTRNLIRDYAEELAGVIVEPLQRCLPPEQGFLEDLRQVTKDYGVVLAFDEVVTGFRLALGGAQEYYGVVPDLVAYGKALGGGFPIGVFGGRADLMQLTSENRRGEQTYVWTASTLGGNPISCTAALAAIDIYEQPGTYEHLHRLGEYLRKGMRDVIHRGSVRATVLGDGPLAQISYTDRKPHDYWSSQHEDRARARKLMLDLFRAGIFLNPMGTKLYLSLAHDEAICDQFLDIFESALTD